MNKQREDATKRQKPYARVAGEGVWLLSGTDTFVVDQAELVVFYRRVYRLLSGYTRAMKEAEESGDPIEVLKEFGADAIDELTFLLNTPRVRQQVFACMDCGNPMGHYHTELHDGDRLQCEECFKQDYLQTYGYPYQEENDHEL